MEELNMSCALVWKALNYLGYRNVSAMTDVGLSRAKQVARGLNYTPPWPKCSTFTSKVMPL
eukprot:scaffold468784_cov23-Prasinocladus_malaysianus.AAC.1